MQVPRAAPVQQGPREGEGRLRWRLLVVAIPRARRESRASRYPLSWPPSRPPEQVDVNGRAVYVDATVA